MANWIFQANPAKYRLLAECVEHDDTSWTANQYADQIKPGDTVVMWLSGPHAGAYAIGEVITAPAEIPEDPAHAKFWTDPASAMKPAQRTRIRYTKRLILKPVLRADATRDPILAGLSVIRQPQGTNFPMTDEQIARVRAHFPPDERIWSREEHVLVLAHYLDAKAGQTQMRGERANRLARMFARPVGGVIMRCSNFESLDDRTQSKGLPNVGAETKRIWDEFRDRPGDLRNLATEIERTLLEGGGLWRFGPEPVGMTTPRYWKIAPGEQAHRWSEMRDAGHIAIGWSKIGHLRTFASKDAVEEQLDEDYPKDTSSATNAAQMWTFAFEIQEGDVVVANRGQSRVVGRGVVTGPYEFRPDQGEYRHCLPVRWFDTIEREIEKQGGWVKTVIEIPADRYTSLFGDDGPPPLVDPAPASKSVLSIYENLRSRGFHFPDELVTSYLLSLKTKPFVILSGISGTGKTKLAQAIAEWAGSEVREVELEEPKEPSPDGSWQFRLQPYTLRHRQLIIGREGEQLFDLPEIGSRPLKIRFGEQTYAGSVGAFKHGRGKTTRWVLRLGIEMPERLAASATVGDFMRISIVPAPDEASLQMVSIERVEKRTKRETETITRHEFVSVRPDWLDGKDVLGFYNLLTEDYVARPFVRLLLRAHRDPDKPYFVILDEMNLARVEHYFADLLSATESRTLDEGRLRQEPLHLHDLPKCEPLDAPDTWQRPEKCASCQARPHEVEKCQLFFDGVQLVPPALGVPPNVYVTGTVNIDETTHMFSPKVLDRANVIEFNRVDLAGYGAAEDRSPFKLSDGIIKLGRTTVAGREDFLNAPEIVKQTLIDFNKLLSEFNLHFGYRVANEIALYVQNARLHVGDDAEMTALDLQILQKILPKLHGPKQQLAEPLRRLLWFCAFGSIETVKMSEVDEKKSIEALRVGSTVAPPGGGDPVTPRFPRSASKLARMLTKLQTQGFVSFIE